MVSKMSVITRFLEQSQPNMKLTDLEGRDDTILDLSAKLRAGQLVSERTGKPYTASGRLVAHFRAFWSWYMRVERRKNRKVEDIGVDLDRRDTKPKFTWIKSDAWKKAIREASRDYKFLLMFTWDTGIRAPKELMNTRVSDLDWDEKEQLYWVSIRDEVSKTFGRKFKLLQFSQPIREYIEQNEFKAND
ncbi:MAG: hypothetical protein ACE5FT_04075 [Candidatus Nanoarchaeia archaeon]